MSKNSEHVKEYKYRLKTSLLHSFGDECLFCDSKDNIEFAHKNPDEMNGVGRGSYKRYIYIKNHMDKFFLLCHDCHHDYDTKGEVLNV